MTERESNWIDDINYADKPQPSEKVKEYLAGLEDIKTTERELIRVASNFDQLYAALRNIGPTIGDGPLAYDTEDLIAKIQMIEKAGIRMDIASRELPRTYGIRKKVQLLMTPEPEVPVNFEEDFPKAQFRQLPNISPSAPLRVEDTPINEPVPYIVGEIPLQKDDVQPNGPTELGEEPAQPEVQPAPQAEVVQPPAGERQPGPFESLGKRADDHVAYVGERLGVMGQDIRRMGTEFKDYTVNVYNRFKEKVRSPFDFLKTRVPGLLTLGWWEVHQAKKMRITGKEVGRDVQAQSELVQETQNLSLDAAQQEAMRMMQEAGTGATNADYERISRQITFEKQATNQQVIETIVKNSVAKARERLTGALFNYSSAQSGDDIINNPEKMKQFENALRAQLTDLAYGQTKKDTVNFAKVISDNLDPEWRRRYVYAGVELALVAGAGLTYAYLSGTFAKLFGGKMAVEGSVSATAEVGKAVTLEIKKNVWNTLVQEAIKNGVQLPQEELVRLSGEVLKANGMYEPEWIKSLADAKGLISSRSIPVGTPIQIPPTVLQAIGAAA